jgi:predicted MFS family arabinose efflux permease
VNIVRPQGFARATAAGFCGTLVGIGLARFAYTPLIPALIVAGWLTPAQAAYLGADNLAGYLLGAIVARRVAEAGGARRMLRAMMVLSTVAFFACAIRLGFFWLLPWRFAAGIAGSVIMVVGPTAVLPHAPPIRRGLVSGVIITGVGAGVAASGTLVPVLLQHGLVVAWCGLGVLAAGLTAAAWRAWPADEVPGGGNASRKVRLPAAGWVVIVQYGLISASLVPHMIFLVDFIARGLGFGLAAGSRTWVLYGVGAAAGPLLTGRLGDRIGFTPALRGSLVLLAGAILVPVGMVSGTALAVSSIVVGAYTTGVVPLILGRLHQVLPAARQRLAWGYATICFALFQAALAYGDSALFAATGRYGVLFFGGSAFAVLALVLDFAGARRTGD